MQQWRDTMSNINLDKKQTDLELLTELNSKKKDYYLTYDHSIKKGTTYNPHEHFKGDNTLLIPKFLSSAFFAFFLIFLIPYAVLYMTATIYDTTVAQQISDIKKLLLLPFGITADQFIFGVAMLLGSFFMVGPFVLLFSGNSSKSNKDDD
jgi:hypothetical protein